MSVGVHIEGSIFNLTHPVFKPGVRSKGFTHLPAKAPVYYFGRTWLIGKALDIWIKQYSAASI
jgi:hypothetical protein